MSVAAGLDWHGLVALEPRLGDLLAEARAFAGRRGYFCALECWYGWGHFGRPSFKDRVVELAGWHRRDEENEALRAWSATVDAMPARNGGIVDLGATPLLPPHRIPEGDDRRLHTRQAYELASSTILNALPPCRGRCGCTR